MATKYNKNGKKPSRIGMVERSISSGGVLLVFNLIEEREKIAVKVSATSMFIVSYLYAATRIRSANIDRAVYAVKLRTRNCLFFKS